MIVRTGLAALPEVLAALGISRPLLVTIPRFAALELPVEHRFLGALPHADRRGVAAAAAAARGRACDGLVALGGGSVIDTAKAVSSELGIPVVSIPTTYAGAEWTSGFGMRDEAARGKAQGTGALVAGIVYEPALTLTLPSAVSCGTALNALAHCAEALYTKGRGPATDADAIAGARLLSRWLPAVMRDGGDLEARAGLLEGARHAGAAMRAGVGIAHAMAQALGGRFGLDHGAMNAICLPAGLRFNADAASGEIARFAEAIGATDAAAHVAELAALGGFARLRDQGVPRGELEAVAEAASTRSGAKANPRPVTAGAVLALLEGVW